MENKREPLYDLEDKIELLEDERESLGNKIEPLGNERECRTTRDQRKLYI